MTIHDGDAHERELKQAIADAVVRVMADFIGRGPTHINTHVNGDVIICVMRDTLTRGERSLAADGRAEDVREMRRRFQDGMRRPACEAIESLTGRRVVSFLSDNDIEAETALECFVLDAPVLFGDDAGLSPAAGS
jgi:uncharacterized protein YbcI